jgi:hypothetical protein
MTAVSILVADSNVMILAQVGENILGCSLKLITTKDSFIVPLTEKGVMAL